MDETTFQRELIHLKNRVAEMANSYHRLPSVPQSRSTSQDTFARQLEDVKTRLQSMQSSLGCLVFERSHLSTPHHILPEPDESSAQDLATPAGSSLDLRSTPLFQQLLAILRADARGMHNRIAALELNFADLDDRIQSLEPSNHTPALSENDDSSFQQWTQCFSPNFRQDCETLIAQPPAAAVVQPETQLGAIVYQDDSATFSSYMPTMDPEVGPREISPAPEGLAFRDREIAQLEELIRRTQDDLRQSEDLVNQKDAQLEQLKAEQQSKDSQIAELDKLSFERGKIAQAYHKEFRQLQTTLQTKDVTLQTRAAQQYALQQSYLRKKEQLVQAGKRIRELEETVQRLQSSESQAINELTASKDGELNKLREFCEVKETLVSKQEQIISRGAGIIEERDEEIEDLSRQLKILSDDHRQEIRERERFARLLNERDEEIKQLQESMTRAFLPHRKALEHRSESTTNSAQPRDGESLLRCSPFATASASAQRRSLSEQWTPQPINKNVRLPHEQQRASAWSQNTPQHKFGVPGIATPPLAQRPTDEQKRDLRRSNSLKLLQRLALAEEGANLPAQNLTEGVERERSGRQRLPLDDISPPLPPAPLPPRPRKTASFAHLSAHRADDIGPEHQRTISKHQSTQEMPRDRFQPYVTSVEEGEQGQ